MGSVQTAAKSGHPSTGVDKITAAGFRSNSQSLSGCRSPGREISGSQEKMRVPRILAETAEIVGSNSPGSVPESSILRNRRRSLRLYFLMIRRDSLVVSIVWG